MSMTYREYDIVNASLQNLTIEMQFQKTMPSDVDHRPSTLEELFGKDAYIIENEVAEILAEIPKNAVLRRDYEWWSNNTRKIESGRYLIVEQKGVDTIFYKVIVCRLDDQDDWDNGMLSGLIKYDNNVNCQGQLEDSASDEPDIYLRNLLKHNSKFRLYRWHGKFMLFPLGNVYWYFTDVRDFEYWQTKIRQPGRGNTAYRETCEICDHDRLSQCRACDLSGEPNPEAFSRQELVDALIEKYRKEEQKS